MPLRLLYLCFLLGSPFWVLSQKQMSADPLATIREASSFSSLRSQLEQRDLILKSSDLPAARKLLWEKYRAEQLADSLRFAEHESRVLSQGKRQMRFSLSVIGDQPKEGYPLYIALHGGGGTRPEVNDSQWEHMQVFYRKSVQNGVYVAPRGVSNTWNLHFMPESYPLYRRLIQNMILYEGVDPNRVYFLGYSAGGDGVYQIAPRLSDLLAGANMSAGHHNGVSPVNLYRVPFLLQVGELDAAYSRNTATVDYAAKLQKLRAEHPEGYLHQVFVHAQAGHSQVRDHSGPEASASVLSDPYAWRENPAQNGTSQTKTDAIYWLSQHRREPLPPSLIWDRETFDSGGPLTHYWLEGSFGENMVGTVKARIEGPQNRVVLEGLDTPVTLWLHEALLDLDQPILVKSPSREITVQPEISLRAMAESLAQRGDPQYIFPMKVRISRP